MNPFRAMLEELVLSSKGQIITRVNTSNGKRIESPDKNIDQAFARLAEIVEKERKVYTLSNHHADVGWNACCDHISKLIKGS